MHLRLALGTGAPEGAVDGGVDALVEDPGAGLLGLPRVDVAQAAVRAADAQVQQLAGQRLRAELVADPAVELGAAELDAELDDRRAANMRLFAADLRATGELRADLSADDVADTVWAMASAEYYLLLVRRRGWTPQRYGEHLRDTWTRVLLTDPTGAAG